MTIFDAFIWVEDHSNLWPFFGLKVINLTPTLISRKKVNDFYIGGSFWQSYLCCVYNNWLTDYSLSLPIQPYTYGLEHKSDLTCSVCLLYLITG